MYIFVVYIYIYIYIYIFHFNFVHGAKIERNMHNKFYNVLIILTTFKLLCKLKRCNNKYFLGYTKCFDGFPYQNFIMALKK